MNELYPPPAPTQPRAARPVMQFSVQTLFVLTALIACGLAAYRIAGERLLIQYFALIFCVGPWFAYLLAESLPIRSRTIRVACGNSVLMLLFFAALKLGEAKYGWQSAAYITMGTLLVWSPQYVAFFWRRAAGI